MQAAWRGGLPQAFVEKPVSSLSHSRRKLVAAVRMLDLELLRDTIKPINRRGGLCDFIHAAPFEIRITQRRVDKYSTRGQRANQFMKVERDFAQAALIIQQPRHVTFAGPTLDLSIHIIYKRIEAATGH